MTGDILAKGLMVIECFNWESKTKTKGNDKDGRIYVVFWQTETIQLKIKEKRGESRINWLLHWKLGGSQKM